MQEPSVVIYKMAETIKKLEEQLKDSNRERDCLAQAIKESAIKAGILTPGFSLNMPQLISLLEDLSLTSKLMPDTRRYQHVKKFLRVGVLGGVLDSTMPPEYGLYVDVKSLLDSVPTLNGYGLTVDELIDAAARGSENESQKTV